MRYEYKLCVACSPYSVRYHWRYIVLPCVVRALLASSRVLSVSYVDEHVVCRYLIDSGEHVFVGI